MKRHSFATAILTAAVTLMTHAPEALGQSVSPIANRSISKTEKPPLYGSHWMAITFFDRGS